MYLVLFIVSVLWSTSSSLPVSDDGLSPEFIQEEKNTLDELSEEALRTGNPFKQVWAQSNLTTFYQIYEDRTGSKSKNLMEVYRLPEILNEGEIRILICYCYDSDFYAEFNKNLREKDGKEYPIATKVLKGAINKLMKHQIGTDQSLPGILFRNENATLFPMFQGLFNKSENGVLKQFTSSSRSHEKAEQFITGPGRMIIKFEDPQVGADVDDFSIFDEFEVLLPVSGVYTVEKAIKDENNNYDVVLSGPRSSGIINYSNVFIIFLSVLTVKFV